MGDLKIMTYHCQHCLMEVPGELKSYHFNSFEICKHRVWKDYSKPLLCNNCKTQMEVGEANGSAAKGPYCNDCF